VSSKVFSHGEDAKRLGREGGHFWVLRAHTLFGMNSRLEKKNLSIPAFGTMVSSFSREGGGVGWGGVGWGGND